MTAVKLQEDMQPPTRPTDVELKAISDSFEAKQPWDVLAYVLETYRQRIVLACSFGAEDVALVDMMHRIDPEVIKRDFAAAGLELETQSNAFRNPQDNLSVGVFDPAVLHKTDRVLFKFRKK